MTFVLSRTSLAKRIFQFPEQPSQCTTLPVYPRRVDFSDLVFGLSSLRHSYIGLVCSLVFLIHNKQSEEVETVSSRKMYVCFLPSTVVVGGVYYIHVCNFLPARHTPNSTVRG